MEHLILLLGLLPRLVLSLSNDSTSGHFTNFTDSNKDMYVINAMVYQVGILSNKTNTETDFNKTEGNQETITFFHNNGSLIDFGKIPEPLQTNVTAQSLVGVAPASAKDGSLQKVPWTTLNNLTSILPSYTSGNQDMSGMSTAVTKVHGSGDQNSIDNLSQNDNIVKKLYKRNIANHTTTPVQITKGTAIIPQDAMVQSIAIPPLLALYNNFTNIPVPIPNTSVVQYAKINTLVHMP